MRKWVLCAVIIIPVVVGLSCSSRMGRVNPGAKGAIYKSKGFFDGKKRLRPEILECGEANGLYGLNIKNTIGTVNENNEFAFLKIDKEGNITVEAIKPGFPPVYGQKYFSDSEHNVMWMVRGRGFYALDIETKASGNVITSGDGNCWIHNSFLVSPEKKIFFIEIAEPPPV
ncbi:MAG: hypothetical protein GY754_36140 [bacterium]|nr:hypothetical protein [bacterium]